MSLLRRNAIANLLGQASQIVIGLVGFRFVYKGLGEDGLGIIYFSLMLSTLLAAALELGLTKTTIRELAGHHASEPEYVIQLLQTFSLIYWGAFAALSALLILSVPLIIGSWVKLATMAPNVAVDALAVIGASSLLVIPKIFMASICVGLQRMHINNAINVGVAILQQAGIIVLVGSGEGISIVSYWIAVMYVLNTLLYGYQVAKLVEWRALVPRYSHQVIVRVKQYLSKMAWISLLAMLNKQVDKLLISMLLPIGALGIYSFAFLTVSKLTLMADALVQAAFPAFSEMHLQDDRRQLRAMFFKLQDVLAYGLVPLFAAIAFLALPLFALLMNEEKSLSLLLPILLLSLAFYLNGTVRLLNVYVSACGKPTYILRSLVMTMIMVTPVTIALIYWFGLVGAGASWLLASLVGAGCMVPAVFGRELQVSVQMWLLPVLKAMAGGVTIYALAWWGIAACSAPTDIVSYAFAYFAASVIYIAFALNLSGGGLRDGALEILPGLKMLILPWGRGK